MKILANDGIDPLGKTMLEQAGFQVDTQNIPQTELNTRLQEYDAITVRSATKIRKELIDLCPGLKLIGRGGVGMDNIDVEYARAKGITVVNTPASSSVSVAELVFGHLLGGLRFLHDANRRMPVDGKEQFNALKKKYASGRELMGSTLGIVGFGRIGREVAKRALAFGMQVQVYDLFPFDPKLDMDIAGHTFQTSVKSVTFDELLASSDYITLHVPGQKDGSALIGAAELARLKRGAVLVNTARGGLIVEEALVDALHSGQVSFAALDVFDNEPTPSEQILSQEHLSLSPHIGAATREAQERIGEELASLIIQHLKR